MSIAIEDEALEKMQAVLPQLVAEQEAEAEPDAAPEL